VALSSVFSVPPETARNGDSGTPDWTTVRPAFCSVRKEAVVSEVEGIGQIRLREFLKGEIRRKGVLWGSSTEEY